jgi:hypothetical protein
MNKSEYGFPSGGPFPTPRDHDLKRNLHNIRKLSCKYDLFWLSGSGEEDF